MAKKRKKQAPFQKQSLKLKPNHTWTVPKGYKIFVADRGAVSFNIPQSWVIGKFEPLEINDVQPPDDNARLSLTFWRFPPGIDWTGLPLIPLLRQSLEGTREESDTDIIEQSEVITADRQDIELVWVKRRFIDSTEKREAFSWVAMARGFDVHALLTFDFWLDHLELRKPVWDEVLRSIQLGRSIQDPTRGEIHH